MTNIDRTDMPSDSERPFGHDTLKLRAVFVPEDSKDTVSRGDITRTLGYHSLKIPAIFVPEGGKRPGRPYMYFGKAVFTRDDGTETRTVTAHQPSWQTSGAASQSPGSSRQSPGSSRQSSGFSWQSPGSSWQSPGSSWQSADTAAQTPESAQRGSEQDQLLPRTRHRFGAARSGNPPIPPNPTVSGGQGNQLRKSVEVWHAMKDAARIAKRAMGKQDQEPPQDLPREIAARQEGGGIR